MFSSTLGVRLLVKSWNSQAGVAIIVYVFEHLKSENIFCFTGISQNADLGR